MGNAKQPAVAVKSNTAVVNCCLPLQGLAVPAQEALHWARKIVIGELRRRVAWMALDIRSSQLHRRRFGAGAISDSGGLNCDRPRCPLRPPAAR